MSGHTGTALVPSTHGGKGRRRTHVGNTMEVTAGAPNSAISDPHPCDVYGGRNLYQFTLRDPQQVASRPLETLKPPGKLPPQRGSSLVILR